MGQRLCACVICWSPLWLSIYMQWDTHVLQLNFDMCGGTKQANTIRFLLKFKKIWKLLGCHHLDTAKNIYINIPIITRGVNHFFSWQLIGLLKYHNSFNPIHITVHVQYLILPLWFHWKVLGCRHDSSKTNFPRNGGV